MSEARHHILGVLVGAVARVDPAGGPERWPEQLDRRARELCTYALEDAHRTGTFFAAVRELSIVASLLERGMQRENLAEELLAIVDDVATRLGVPQADARPLRVEKVLGGARALRAPVMNAKAPAASLKARRLAPAIRI